MKKVSIVLQAIEAQASKGDIEQNVQYLTAENQEIENQIQEFQSKMQNNIQEIELLQASLEYEVTEDDRQWIYELKKQLV